MFSSGSLLVTEDCNLRCTYCFEEHKQNKMSIEVAQKTLEFFFTNAENMNERERFVGITLFGGEPTLNPEVCIYLIEEGHKMSESTGIPFSVTMITNCTFLPPALGETVKNHIGKVQFNIQLSVDGIPEVHNEYRITKQGGPSMDMVKKTIPLWKEVMKNDPESLNIHGCLNKKTISRYFESYKFFKYELGLPLIWFLPIAEEDWDENDVTIYHEQCQLIYDDIIATYVKTKDKNYLHDIAPFNRAFSGCKATSDKPCAAGDTYCSITANGDIYPCHQFYYSKNAEEEMKLGNIIDGVKYGRNKLFVDYDGSDLSCVKDCDHGHCYRCIANNYIINGSIFKQTMGYYCKLMKVDQYFQKLLLEEANKMGIQSGMSDPGNQCNQHTSDPSGGCDVVEGASKQERPETGQHVRPEKEKSCGDSCSCGSDKSDDRLLKLILLELKKTQFELEYIKQRILLDE